MSVVGTLEPQQGSLEVISASEEFQDPQDVINSANEQTLATGCSSHYTPLLQTRPSMTLET